MCMCFSLFFSSDFYLLFKGFTPLQFACYLGYEEIVEILVDGGAKIDAVSPKVSLS